MLTPAESSGASHACDFREEYYGHRCTGCGVYYPFGCAPWDIADDGLDDMDDWEDGEWHDS